MDIIILGGVYRNLRREIGAWGWVLVGAMARHAVVPMAFVTMKWQSDPLIFILGLIGLALVFLFVRSFLVRSPIIAGDHENH